MLSNVWGRWVVVDFENVLHHAGHTTTKALFYLRRDELSTGEGRFFFAKYMVYRLPKRRFSAVEPMLGISHAQFLAMSGFMSTNPHVTTAVSLRKVLICMTMMLRRQSD
jgi:hypothetical protein